MIGAMQQIALLGKAPESDIARMFLGRTRPFCVDIQHEFPEQNEEQRRLKHGLDEKFHQQIGVSVFRDSAKLSIYGEIGADDSRAQKRLMIQLKNGRLREITDFGDATIVPSSRQRNFDRYYFIDQNEFKPAKRIVDEIGRRTVR